MANRRGRGGTARKPVYKKTKVRNPPDVQLPSIGYTGPIVTPGNVGVSEPVPRDWDSDAPEENPAYSDAVHCLLERLEGLWYESDYFFEDGAERFRYEQAVNGYLQDMKQKIQGLL